MAWPIADMADTVVIVYVLFDGNKMIVNIIIMNTDLVVFCFGELKPPIYAHFYQANLESNNFCNCAIYISITYGHIYNFPFLFMHRTTYHHIHY